MSVFGLGAVVMQFPALILVQIGRKRFQRTAEISTFLRDGVLR
jgi:hypothetical protein